MKKLYTLIILLVISSVAFSRPKAEINIINIFDELTLDIHYYYSTSVQRLDSLKQSLSPDENQYIPYIQCLEGLIAYKEADYDLALNKTDSALRFFVLDRNNKWEAQCLLHLGYISESIYLNNEALETYLLTTNLSQNSQTLGLAHLGLARSQKRIGKKWSNSYNIGLRLLNKGGDIRLKLYARTIPFWFYNDSSDAPQVLESVAKEYAKLGIHSRAMASYKRIAIYYNQQDSFDLSLTFSEKAIEEYKLEEESSPLSISSVLYVKAKSYYYKNELDSSKKHFETCISLKNNTRLEHCNYSTFRYLYRQDTLQGKYKQACTYNDKALKCQIEKGNLRAKRATRMASVFLSREETKEALRHLRRKTYLEGIATIIILIILSASLITWHIKKKRNAEKKASELLKANERLEIETGSLLENNEKQRAKQTILNYQKEIEKLIDKSLIDKKQLPKNFHTQYIELLVKADERLLKISLIQRKYAVLLAMNTPLYTIASIMNVDRATVKQNTHRIRINLGINGKNLNLRHYLIDKLS